MRSIKFDNLGQAPTTGVRPIPRRSREIAAQTPMTGEPAPTPTPVTASPQPSK